MYDHILNYGSKHFLSLLALLVYFSTEEILKPHIKDCLKINSKQRNKMPKKDEYVKFRSFERKKKSLKICTDFESILVPENNGKQNSNESYTNKHVASSYGYKLVYVDDKFRRPFKSYLGGDFV